MLRSRTRCLLGLCFKLTELKDIETAMRSLSQFELFNLSSLCDRHAGSGEPGSSKEGCILHSFASVNDIGCHTIDNLFYLR